MSFDTTLSPGCQGYDCATRLIPQLVLGRKAISSAFAPRNRAHFPRVVSISPYQLRQSAAPRSLWLATCAVIESATRRGRGATEAG
jgi:hypothetical protein